jgi:hypothetical protein
MHNCGNLISKRKKKERDGKLKKKRNLWVNKWQFLIGKKTQDFSTNKKTEI